MDAIDWSRRVVVAPRFWPHKLERPPAATHYSKTEPTAKKAVGHTYAGDNRAPRLDDATHMPTQHTRQRIKYSSIVTLQSIASRHAQRRTFRQFCCSCASLTPIVTCSSPSALYIACRCPEARLEGHERPAAIHGDLCDFSKPQVLEQIVIAKT